MQKPVSRPVYIRSTESRTVISYLIFALVTQATIMFRRSSEPCLSTASLDLSSSTFDTPSFLLPPPPPYQETLPENHSYKSGMRILPTVGHCMDPSLLKQIVIISPPAPLHPTEMTMTSTLYPSKMAMSTPTLHTNQMTLSTPMRRLHTQLNMKSSSPPLHPNQKIASPPYLSHSTPHLNLDLSFSYEDSFCPNFTLDSLDHLGYQDMGCHEDRHDTPASSSSTTKSKISELWKQLTKWQRGSRKKVTKVKTATLKRSISTSRIFKKKTSSKTPSPEHQRKNSLPRKGIVKPPRLQPLPSPDSSSASEETKLKKSVSFNSKLNNVRILSPDVDTECTFQFPPSYAVKDYVFTRL